MIVVSSDAKHFLSAESVVPTLQAALENWNRAEPALRTLAAQLERGEGKPLTIGALAAPLPRAWQWLDGSAFDAHGHLMTKLFGVELKQGDRPLMYQGLSHQFLAPTQDVPLPSEDHGIDFEGEFGVITDAVPMGVTPQQAAEHIRLIVMLNDWSLRALAAVEMKTGFGWIHAKPACSMAPFAVTPDELGAGWADGRVHLRLRVEVNGNWFGQPHGGEMGISFGSLVAHAAATRSLCAGTIIGSGTVSNADYRTSGSTCIAERRAIETLDCGAAITPFLRFGDRVRMAAIEAVEAVEDGAAQPGRSPFGEIDQRVVQFPKVE